MKIPIEKINIGERQRLDLGDLKDLDSMSDPKIGQILPIVLDATYLLIDGRRRLAKAVELGWKEVEVSYKGNIDETTKQKMEYFADVARKDRTWQERCLAIYKIYKIIKYEKNAEGEGWSLREMEAFSGESRSTLWHLFGLAQFLLREPRDEQLWNCNNQYDGIKLLVERNATEAQAELERRQRARAEIAKASVPPTENEAASPSPVQNQDSTEPERIVMYINGFNIDFKDAVEGKHYDKEKIHALLGYNKFYPEFLSMGLPAVLWLDGAQSDEIRSRAMYFPLIWNKVSAEDSTEWPFVKNYSLGFVMNARRESQICTQGSVISVIQSEPGELPHHVVSFCLDPLCPSNSVVLCPCNAPVLALAETGRVPVFFEPDPLKFEKKVAELREYYESTIPNVEVRLREV